MRTFTVVLLACAGLGLGLLVQCGGGGSSKSPTANLDAQSAETLARNAADVVLGCGYSSQVSLSVAPADPASGVRGVVAASTAAARAALAHYRQARSAKPTEDINEVVDGDCGGSYLTAGTHDSGTTQVTMTFNSYCTEAADGQVVVDGAVSVVQAGHPSDTGPVTEEIRLSTGSAGLTVAETSEGTPQTHRIRVDNLKYHVGVPGGQATEANPDLLTVDRVQVIEGDQATYELQDVRVTAYQAGDNLAFRVDGATYTDPDVGSVTIRTSIMTTGGGTQGTVTITGSSGTTVTLTKDPFAQGVFTVSQNGALVGAVNCASLGAAADSLGS